ncbi:MAG TPA: sulfotransferase [Bacteroidales bacterium]|nr:sulfotransferase [Bacteroidales bacterium]
MKSDSIAHSRNFEKRPFWFTLVNSSWKATYFLGTKIILDKDELIRSAKKVTGLDDLGKDFSDEPLEKLLRSVNEEADLHPVGRFITRQRFISLLSIRLRAEYFFHRHPEILEQPLYPAWIIIGLQRTGTTKLQRLLAADPDHRVIPSWEVINPIPLTLNEMARDKRIAVARTSVRALKLISPGFFAIHPIDIYEPEEDILLLDVSFLSTTPEAMMHVPSYADWLEKTDQSAAYAYAVKLLKFLQWKKPAKRWVLKTPHHLEFPDLIEKHFGEVHYLWPHRRIYESVPSFLSMVTYNHMIFSDHVDEKIIAAHWVRKTGYMLDKALGYRAKDNNPARFTDIFYDDLIQNSEKELSRIYSLDGGLTPELITQFGKHEKEHPHRKYGTHQYSLADFGLTEADIDKHTRRYRQFIAEHYGR